MHIIWFSAPTLLYFYMMTIKRCWLWFKFHSGPTLAGSSPGYLLSREMLRTVTEYRFTLLWERLHADTARSSNCDKTIMFTMSFKNCLPFPCGNALSKYVHEKKKNMLFVMEKKWHLNRQRHSSVFLEWGCLRYLSIAHEGTCMCHIQEQCKNKSTLWQLSKT